MATAQMNPPVSTAADAPSQTTSSRRTSPMTVALATGAACIVVVWVAVTGLLLILTATSTWSAIGVGAYAAFWLGGGFGAIFASAAVFSKDH